MTGPNRESEQQRWRRNFADLLQELRVAQTGVQILFAFLLTLPFSSGFARATEFQKNTYVVALLSSAAAAALTISPVAVHRALFRKGRKPQLVRHAHHMAGVGLAFLLVAMVSAVLLVTDVVLSRPVAFLLSGLTAIWFLTLWAVLPLWHRGEDEIDDEHEDHGPPGD